MLIKFNHLTFRLPKKQPAIYILTGNELFQLNSLADLIKQTWYKDANQVKDDIQINILDIQSASDWTVLEQEANSYSLFSSLTLLDVRFDKKILDAPAKLFFQRYLSQHNPCCLIMIRAPHLALKQLQSLTHHNLVQVIQLKAPDATTIKHWLGQQLEKITPNYDPAIPALIHQYNEGNLLASAQVIEKLALITDPMSRLTLEQVSEQLVNQCEYRLFELADACLTGNTLKALQLLAQALTSKTEPTLVLWLLTQEIRLLIQLCATIINPQSDQSFRQVASQLKIWPQRQSMYQQALTKYHNPDLLVTLLQRCQKLDCHIKTQQNQQVWHSLELIALSLCSGQQVGYFA